MSFFFVYVCLSAIQETFSSFCLFCMLPPASGRGPGKLQVGALPIEARFRSGVVSTSMHLAGSAVAVILSMVDFLLIH